MTKRGDQSEYDRMLDAFNGRNMAFHECVNHLVSQGFSVSQANNAVHVYRKGGATKATSRLSRDHRDELLDDFGANGKTNKRSVDYLRNLGYTYRQATSAVYQYRKDRGLIGK